MVTALKNNISIFAVYFYNTPVTSTHAHPALPLRPGKYESVRESTVGSQKTTC